MCLIKQWRKTIRAKWRGPEEYTVYKIVRKSYFDGQLYTPYRYTMIDGNILWAEGKPKLFMLGEGGIHVFLNQKDAQRERDEYGTNAKVLICKAKRKHLVAIGLYGNTECAMFKEIYIPQEELDKAYNDKY